MVPTSLSLSRSLKAAVVIEMNANPQTLPGLIATEALEK